MTPAQFVAFLDYIGWSACYVAGLFGKTRQAAGNWRLGRTPIPRHVALWLAGEVAHRQLNPPPKV